MIRPDSGGGRRRLLDGGRRIPSATWSKTRRA